MKKNISVEVAPEPEDVIFENLEFNWTQRLIRILFVYIISFFLIAICFVFILYLNNVQISKSHNEDKNNIVYRYCVSTSISLSIAIINSIFENILVILTKMEKQICMTNYFLSYSIKLTILTYFSSVLIPYLSSNHYKEQINHDILITNCITMFISNSFLIPITWTINFECILKKLRICIINRKKKRLRQNELNSLYELLDMDIATKYSYVARTLMMCFFYLPIFPLGIPICCLGFIFIYYLEKYNFIKQYKKPINLNSRIYEVYSNYFVINLFMASLGEYLFLKDTLSSNFWLILNIILFSILLIFPYNNILSIDLIGINESDIKKDELYEEYFYKFINDYERNNPITKKDGIKHFLDKLIEKVLITKNDYDTILRNYEHMNLLEIYYKSKFNFGYNLIKRAFFSENILKKKINKRASLDLAGLKKTKFIKEILKPMEVFNNKEKENKIKLRAIKEEPKIENNIINIFNQRPSKNIINNNILVLNFSGKGNIYEKEEKVKYKNKRSNKIYKKLQLRKNFEKKGVVNISSKRDLFISKKNTIENEESN